MRLMYTHHLAGPGRVNVQAGGMRIFITVTDDTEYRKVDIVADGNKAAWAGPSGVAGVAFGVEVGRPGPVSALKDMLGLRQGSSVSGGGSVVSSGRGSIAAGGSITYAATGRNSSVTINGRKQPQPENGIHLTVPRLCTFNLKNHDGVSVFSDGVEMTLQLAEERGLLAVTR